MRYFRALSEPRLPLRAAPEAGESASVGFAGIAPLFLSRPAPAGCRAVPLAAPASMAEPEALPARATPVRSKLHSPARRRVFVTRRASSPIISPRDERALHSPGGPALFRSARLSSSLPASVSGPWPSATSWPRCPLAGRLRSRTARSGGVATDDDGYNVDEPAISTARARHTVTPSWPKPALPRDRADRNPALSRDRLHPGVRGHDLPPGLHLGEAVAHRALAAPQALWEHR